MSTSGDPRISFGPQLCGNLAESCRREWLVTDGCGGYAMGTVAGLRTRRYHGLLMVCDGVVGERHLGLASLDPVLVIGSERVRLATHRWRDGTVAPTGYEHLVSFSLRDGVPSWQWAVGEVVLRAELAASHGRPALGVAYRLVHAPAPVRLEVGALCTWRDQHGERLGSGDPAMVVAADGFVFEDSYRVEGPGFSPTGVWWRGVSYDEEEERGLPFVEDLFYAGYFSALLSPGEGMGVRCVGRSVTETGLGVLPPDPETMIAAARGRARGLLAASAASDTAARLLVLAADQHIVAGPDVVAGYPWFGAWSRDTMVAYEGLFLATGRAREGREVLCRAAASLVEGLLANTTDISAPAYNSVDAPLWFIHALDRHVALTSDHDLGAELVGACRSVIDHYLRGTRFAISVGPDGLVREGESGVALTWMDARIAGVPVTERSGTPVEIQALFVAAVAVTARLTERAGGASGQLASLRALEKASREAFEKSFLAPLRGDRSGSGPGVPKPRFLADLVADGSRVACPRAGGDGPLPAGAGQLRPNQLLGAALRDGPVPAGEIGSILAGSASLLTPLGLRSLSPDDPSYHPYHRGGPEERDAAYHQGTVWPYLIGAYLDCCDRAGVATDGLLDGLVGHLGDYGLGSVSETADGAAPHRATGCPFQAWSVAELLRVLG